MLYYEMGKYPDDTLAITTWIDEDGYLEPYGDVTVNLSAYGLTPAPGCVFLPTYNMPEDYLKQVLHDIAADVVMPIPIGHGSGLMVRLKKDWQKDVNTIDII